MTRFFLFFLLFHQVFGHDSFQNLTLGGPYTSWKTEGNLSSILFRVELDSENPPSAIIVSVNYVDFTFRNPLSVTVIRGKTVQSFSLPRVQSHNEAKYEHWFATDTLCDDDRSMEQLRQPVQISISSSLPSAFTILVMAENHFEIGAEPFQAVSTTAGPTFYLYTFPENVEKVNIRAFSESSMCARLITRRKNCPLFDGSGLLEMSDVYYYQTFTKFAGFSLMKSDIGPQFHLAIAIDPDDSSCGGASYSSNQTHDMKRVKSVTISVIPVSENLIRPLIPLLIYILSMFMVLLITYLKYKWLDRYENNEPSIFEGNDSDGTVMVDKKHLFDGPNRIVSHKEYEKQRLVKDTQYFKFLFFQIFGSILPALTILFQNRQNSSNNLDTCYLNYLCTQDVFSFLSFNTMTSSTSMALIGFLNLLIVFRKKIFRYQIPRFPTTHGIQQRDAPKVVFCLGLIAEGIPRMIIYNCQDKSTGHFYAFTAAWVNYSVIFWIYSKRHGVRKWQQFYIIAVSSILGCFALAEYAITDNGIHKGILKILFVLFAVSSTGYFCCKYYFEKPSGLMDHQWISKPFDRSEKTLSDENGRYQPLKSKICLVVLSLTVSIISSTLPLYTKFTVAGIQSIFVQSQLGIYSLYYYIQKIRFERSSMTPKFVFYTSFLTFWIIFLTVVNRCLGAYLNTYSVSATPAKSREFNKECVLPGIDWNHVRHYNGALIWFIFLLLMDYIDSNMKGAPKKHIFVF